MATSPSSPIAPAASLPEASSVRRLNLGAEGRQSAHRDSAAMLREVILVGAVFLIGQVMLQRSLDITGEMAHAAVVAGAAVGAYLCLRRMVVLPVWASLLGAVLFVCHPLCVANTHPSITLTEALPLLLAPWILLLCRQCAQGRRIGIALAFAAMLGIAGTLCAAVWKMAMVLPMLCLAVEFTLIERQTARRRPFGRFVPVTTVAALSGLASFAALSRSNLLSTSLHVGPAQTALTAPLASVDRDGALSSRLAKLPAEFISDGGAHYLGVSLIILCLIALWPSRHRQPSRRVAAWIMLAMFLTWLSLGKNIHIQLLSLLEFATVRRYVEPLTLHLLGGMIVFLLTVGLLLFLSTARLISGSGRWTFPAVMIAAALSMIWWRTAPPELWPAITRWLAPERSLPFLQTLAAMLLVGAAAMGLHRAVGAQGIVRRRLLTVAIIVALIAVDVYPYAKQSWMQSGELTKQEIAITQTASQ